MHNDLPHSLCETGAGTAQPRVPGSCYKRRRLQTGRNLRSKPPHRHPRLLALLHPQSADSNGELSHRLLHCVIEVDSDLHQPNGLRQWAQQVVVGEQRHRSQQRPSSSQRPPPMGTAIVFCAASWRSTTTFISPTASANGHSHRLPRCVMEVNNDLHPPGGLRQWAQPSSSALRHGRQSTARRLRHP